MNRPNTAPKPRCRVARHHARVASRPPPECTNGPPRTAPSPTATSRSRHLNRFARSRPRDPRRAARHAGRPGPRAPAARIAATADDVWRCPREASAGSRAGQDRRRVQPRRSLNGEDAAALEQILARNSRAIACTTKSERIQAAVERQETARSPCMRSPLGQKIIALEVAAGVEAGSAQRMIAFALAGRVARRPRASR